MKRRTFLAVAGGAVVAVVAGQARAEQWRVTRVPLDLANLSALATGPDGGVYVAAENWVIVVDRRGWEKRRFAVEGKPGCLCVLPDGRMLVGLHRRVEVFEGGKRVAAWNDLGERAWLTSICADEQNVYAADAGNRLVWRFDGGGKVLNRFGEFVVPSPYFDVAINAIGELWVANPGKHGLENYRPNGDLASSWYRSGIEPEAFCGCCNPAHFAFRSDCSIVTYEKGIDRIKILAPDMTLVGVVAGRADAPGVNNATLGCSAEAPVADLAVDSQNRILVLNRAERALLVYETVDEKGAAQ